MLYSRISLSQNYHKSGSIQVQQNQNDSLVLVIRKRRLIWLGHVQRLKEDTLHQLMLKVFCTEAKTKRPAGRPKLTWLKLVLKDIAENSCFYTETYYTSRRSYVLYV